MHDIDRTFMESEEENEGFQSEAFEFQPETFEFQPETFEFQQFRSDGSGPPVLGETQEMELAASLLEVRDEAELDRFLGDLISQAGRAAGKFISSPTGQALGGILKGAAAQALPVVGSAIGARFGGARGQQVGSQIASALGQAVGLEMEGTNTEQNEFEVARGLVRFGAEAVRNAAMAGPGADPRATARAAAVQAAKTVAPGLLRSNGMGKSPTASPQGTSFGAALGMPMDASSIQGGGVAGQARSGRWLRRGSKIVLYGV